MKYDALKERSLANFELLLDFWKVDYKKITEREYDILAFWRKDKNFGSCRFNIDKGRGADFASSSFSQEDFKLFGTGFDENDFSGFSDEGSSKAGFDIIGLCQRVYRCNTYQDAAKYLNDDLRTLAREKDIIIPSEERIKEKQLKQEKEKKRILEYAKDLWESAKYNSLSGSLGEKYLNSRGIYKLDKNIRFHPCIRYTPDKTYYPALLFKVQSTPESDIQALHRIYLSQDGKKADIPNPKMILSTLRGNAIWFGEKCDILYIAEGPENALTCIEMGAKFSVSTISSENFSNIVIPEYVNKLILVPDPDPAGLKSIIKLRHEKEALCKIRGLKIEQLDLPLIKKSNGKYKDINDIHLGA
jgi:hypothetical protein